MSLLVIGSTLIDGISSKKDRKPGAYAEDAGVKMNDDKRL
jgi:hypothetical protein